MPQLPQLAKRYGNEYYFTAFRSEDNGHYNRFRLWFEHWDKKGYDMTAFNEPYDRLKARFDGRGKE